MATLPVPRGPLSEQVRDLLRGTPRTEPVEFASRFADSDAADRALALWMLHELHYRGFGGVDEGWEWSPATLTLRHALETAWEAEVRDRFAAAPITGHDAHADADTLVERFEGLLADDDGPSLSAYVHRRATLEEVHELLRQRSIYHLKEADPTTWVVPRLAAEIKAPLVHLQFDEYGAGDPHRLHHALFAAGLRGEGLDDTYGAHIDEATTAVLEQNNTVSMFGLHRRLRAAALGHLAAFEATSSIPSRRIAQGLRRAGCAPEIIGYYDEHVEADAVHEQLALLDICQALVRLETHLVDDVLLGAWTALDLERRVAADLLARWAQKTSALETELRSA